MKIESLRLDGFRNYRKLELSFSGGTNLFFGENAQGKTNILEALFVCGTTRSHRSAKDREMILFGEEEAHIRMQLKRREIDYRIDLHLKKNKAKGIAVNGVPVRKASELIGICNFVFFSPEDLGIIKNGPGERRRFLDLELCQLEQMYVHALANYNRALMQRNRLLKDMAFRPDYKDTLGVWDEQLAEYGGNVIRSRAAFVERLNGVIREIHSKLSGQREEIEIVYEKNCSSEEFRDRLSSDREKDLQLKMTCSGPHRDDLLIMSNGIDLRKFGSQGQQRTAALSLKLAEIRLVKESIGEMPVLLLDDVLSELDKRRQQFLLESIDSVQTMITCTGIEDFENSSLKIDRLFYVKNGDVEEKERPDV